MPRKPMAASEPIWTVSRATDGNKNTNTNDSQYRITMQLSSRPSARNATDECRGRVVLRACVDCVVAMSVCPQNILPINGAGAPSEAHYQIPG